MISIKVQLHSFRLKTPSARKESHQVGGEPFSYLYTMTAVENRWNFANLFMPLIGEGWLIKLVQTKNSMCAPFRGTNGSTQTVVAS